MQGDEILVMIIMLSLIALIFGIFYIRNRENMALIERGINPRNSQKASLPKPFTSLKYGLLFLGCGLGLLLAFFIDFNLNHTREIGGGKTYHEDFPQIYFGLIAVGGGLGLVISYFVERRYFNRIREREE